MIIVTLAGIKMIYNAVMANYQWENKVMYHWHLADKASTLDAKAAHISGFVKALESEGLSGNNAIWLKTPNNSFEKNLEAIKTLQHRLEEIKTMDVNSFQYQQAISQITAQEQGEAKAMLAVFDGIWTLQNYPTLWDWITLVLWLLIIGGGILGAALLY